jgi:hypothetical protein
MSKLYAIGLCWFCKEILHAFDKHIRYFFFNKNLPKRGTIFIQMNETKHFSSFQFAVGFRSSRAQSKNWIIAFLEEHNNFFLFQSVLVPKGQNLLVICCIYRAMAIWLSVDCVQIFIENLYQLIDIDASNVEFGRFHNFDKSIATTIEDSISLVIRTLLGWLKGFCSH